MTDKEIIKALECCACTDNCSKCPYYHYPYKHCTLYMKQDAINLIKRQQEEIENLNKVIEQVDDVINPLPFETDYEKAIKVARTEAIKEFAEKASLAMRNSQWQIDQEDVVNRIIYETMKEMVGDEE